MNFLFLIEVIQIFDQHFFSSAEPFTNVLPLAGPIPVATNTYCKRTCASSFVPAMDKRKVKKGVKGFKRALQGVARRTAGNKRRDAEKAAAAAAAAHIRPMLQTEELSSKAAKKAAVSGGWLDGIAGNEEEGGISGGGGGGGRSSETTTTLSGRDRFFAGVLDSHTAGGRASSSDLRTSTPIVGAMASPAATVVHRRAAKRSRLADDVGTATFQYVVTNTKTAPAGGVITVVSGVYSTLAMAIKSAATTFTFSSGIASCHARVAAPTTLSDAHLVNGVSVTAYSTHNPAPREDKSSSNARTKVFASSEAQRRGGRHDRSGHGVKVCVTRLLLDGPPVA